MAAFRVPEGAPEDDGMRSEVLPESLTWGPAAAEQQHGAALKEL